MRSATAASTVATSWLVKAAIRAVMFGQYWALVLHCVWGRPNLWGKWENGNQIENPLALERRLLAEADLLHELLVVPEQVFLVHCAVLPMTDSRHLDLVGLAGRPDGLALPVGIGCVKVPSMTPMTAVHSRCPSFTGCSLIRCRAPTQTSPSDPHVLVEALVVCPSGQWTVTLFEWLR